MHWTQALYIGLLCIALWSSWYHRAPPLAGLVMIGNLAATLALAADPVMVGLADAVCASILLYGNLRAKVVAMLFSVMCLIYVSAWAFSWPAATTYTIIDLIAYVQLGVIGGVDRGLGRACRAFARRGNDARGAAPDGRDPACDVARLSEPHRPLIQMNWGM